MATIELKGVEKQFGDHTAVKPMDLTIDNGEFVVLLGPSGCGKTTTLRMISGLEAVTHGQILFDGKDVTWVSPSGRNIAFVFQFFALYSHMTSRDNIAFPLQAQRLSRREIHERVERVAEMLRIKRILDARPGGLSGGDQQRVALARALVRRPAAFLMDEPLGALDAEFRESMRAEIKRLHVDQEATTVYVTHDQIEAMAMGDKIVVMSDAEIQQVGTPAEVYDAPANLFVARFIGSPGMNLVECTYQDGEVHFYGNRVTVPEGWRAVVDEQIGNGEPVVLGFRPEAAELSTDGEISAEVYATDLYGGYTMLVLSLDDDEIIEVRVSRSERYSIGDHVRLTLKPDMVRFFDPRSEWALEREKVAVQ